MADSDRIRATAVAVTAVTQVLSSVLTPVLLGDDAATGTVSDANRSPVTPAGYAFAVWGLLFLASLVLAGYQLLPGQRSREVHRRTGWPLAGAFAGSTLFVPVFGTRAIWLAQLVLLAVVACLAVAARRASRLGPASGTAERLCLRLPTTLYLGWVTLAAAAGFGTTFRSLGLPPRGPLTTLVALLLVLAAAVVSVVVVGRLLAVAGYALTACWALLAVAVATTSWLVAAAAVLALLAVLAVLLRRSQVSRHPARVLVG